MAWLRLGALSIACSSLFFACATGVSIRGGEGGESGEGGDDTSGGYPSTGTGNPPSDAGPPVPDACTEASQCNGLTDACNAGACINGKCEKAPSNEYGSCDDGLFCTENDVCQNGACVGGTARFCPSLDSCHLGMCDEELKTCKNMAGNEGGACDDGDTCTYLGQCAGGACSKGPQIDCTAFDSQCTKGVCDPAVGCKAAPANEGGSCSDNLYCTINDKCSSGSCGGEPNTCAAPGDVCMIGACNESTDTCVAVPGNDGAGCNDGNDCTAGETCSNGACLGGQPANEGMLCDDEDGCTGGTTCANGLCQNPQSQIMQCLDNDQCCPDGCAVDNDCQICHPIGFDKCPTGAIEWCTTDDIIDPMSPTQAKTACETCYGVECFLENADCAGLAYGPKPPGQYVNGDAYFGYESGCSGDDGRVWSIGSSFTTYGYWGK